MTCRSTRWMVALALAAAACGGSGAPERSSTSGPAAAPAASVPAASAPAASSAPLRSVADLFPESPAKALAMNNCASCHNVACSVIGQRSAERWEALREGHRDRLPEGDLQTIFTYLKANFDSSKPEPKVPPDFLQGGCTPF